MKRKLDQVQAANDTERFDIVHARLLRLFPDLVVELGGQPELLFERVGIDPRAVSEGHAEASYRQMVDLIGLAASDLDCPDFGMRLAQLQSRAGMLGPLGSVMQNSRTFGEALAYVAEHSYAHSLAARIWLERSPDTDNVFVGHDILLGHLPNRAQAIEQILLDGHLVAMEITGGHARARRVHFRHQPISPLKVYRRNFGCEVRFGQNEDGVVFCDRDLASAVTTADASAYKAAIAYVEAHFTRHRPPLHAEARGLVMRFLATDYCTNEHVAAALNLHARTMHRRLAAEGTSFQQVKDEVRSDVMLYFLQQTDLDVAAISAKLGFAEQSTMTRSCRKRFSMPPTALRARARNHA